MKTVNSSIIDIEQAIISSPLILTATTLAVEAIRLMSQVRDSCQLANSDLIPSINKLNLEKASCVLVVDNQKLIGTFTERDIVRCTAMEMSLEQVTLAEVMSSNPVTLKKSEFHNIFVVLNLFRQYKIRHLSIVDDQGDLIGLVTPTTLRQLIQVADFLKIRCVEEVMAPDVIQAAPTASILDLAQLMTEHCVSCVVITQSDTEFDSQPIGIVTERDIVQFRALELDPVQIKAHVVMSSPLFYLRPQQSLWEAHQKMQKLRVRSLVVVGDRNQLLGIVTQTSVLYTLDPLELYEIVNFLQQKVFQLESEKIDILHQQNLELETKVQERTTRLIAQANSDRLLAVLSQRIRQYFDIEVILQTAVSEIQQYLHTDRVIIYQFEAEWSGRIIAEFLAPNQISLLGDVIHDPCFAPTWVEPYTNGRVRAIDDIYTSGLADCHVRLLEEKQIRANLVVPIVYNNQLWGLISAHQCSQARHWESTEIEFLQKLSNQIAIAIQQCQLYEQAQQEIKERTQAEAALQKLNEELEIRVVERTAELQHSNQNLLLEIQERQRVDQELRHSQQRLHNILNSLFSFVGVISTEGIIIEANEAWLKIFSLTDSSVIGKPFAQTSWWSYSAKIQNKIQSAISQAAQGNSIRYDIPVRFTEEKFITIDFSIKPVFDESGEVSYLVVSGIDITERKQAEDTMKKQLAAIESTIDGIAILQGDRYLYLNKAHVELFGYDTDKELIGKTWRELYTPPEIARLESDVFPILREKGHWGGEAIAQRRDGSTFDEEISLTMTNDGELICVCRDISKRKLAQQEIYKILEREKELNQLKSRFISMTSHEFRTPLAVISSSAGILKEFSQKLDEEKKQKHLECIITYVKHTTQLLDEILLISKAEAGKLAFEPKPLDLVEFCQKLTSEMQLSTPNNKILFSSNTKTEVIALVDKKLLRQILINLLSNAVKYSQNNSSVKFDLQITEQSIIFSIQDQGIGIPQADKTQLFEAFHRATNVGSISGTGLGLTIVKNCVDLHGGKVTVVSQEGIGTKFTVIIPLQSVSYVRKL
ncbi:CBS domain-containing protein [Nodularia spumigena]|uniref:CBS domain-containing protein n=2 Tax=Nodularia spumigena TaxID=70799 RepID=UPI00232DE9EB|nr:CBS domain-containing protein [Nodularia spumigena]MDB9317038.1 CBS domain-containing protein [Nodularia spumigena CS-590/01A]